MGILNQRVTAAIKTNALYTRVKETDNKLHNDICDGLLLTQSTIVYENHYIPVEPVDMEVSLRDFILYLNNVHSGPGHFSCNKCYFYGAGFFCLLQMCQDFVLYCQ